MTGYLLVLAAYLIGSAALGVVVARWHCARWDRQAARHVEPIRAVIDREERDQ